MRIKHHKGFSVLEVIVALALFMVFVAGLAGALVSGQKRTAEAGARARAVALAEEGLEAVRSIRDKNFCDVTDGPHGLSVSAGGIWTFSGTSDAVENYTRQISVSTPSATTKDVTATVSWQYGGQSLSTSLTTRFTRWRGTAATWWDSAWLNRRKITFANGTRGQLDNFPVLVKLDNDAPVNFDYLKSPSGADIRFVDPSAASSGCTPAPILSHEIERWNDANGQSFVWVKVPQIDATSNVDFVWMYYNNPAATDPQTDAFVADVWSNGYEGVWHLDEDPSITTDGRCGGSTVHVCDSTGNTNHLTMNGGMTSSDQVPGVIAGSIDFDGSTLAGATDFLTISHAEQVGLDINGLNPITLEAWVNNPTTPISSRVFLSKDSAFPEGYFLRSSDGPRYTLKLALNGATGDGNLDINANTPSGSLIAGVWQQVVGLWNNTTNTMQMYVNGSPSGGPKSYTEGIYWATVAFNIGTRYGTQQPFIGTLDEARVSSVVRTPDWISAQYESMRVGGAFAAYGPEETQ